MTTCDAPLPPGRRDEVAELLDTVRRWASHQLDVHAVALGGSWTRGDPRADSDVDLVLLTERTSMYLTDDRWTAQLSAVEIVRTQQWGALTERRLALASGLEVDVALSWASTSPLDRGTRGVVADGLEAVYDPDGILAALIDAVHIHPVSRYEADVAAALARCGARVVRRRDERATMMVGLPSGTLRVVVRYLGHPRDDVDLTEEGADVVVVTNAVPDAMSEIRAHARHLVRWNGPTDDGRLARAVRAASSS